jgi:hypothetical protein
MILLSLRLSCLALAALSAIGKQATKDYHNDLRLRAAITMRVKIVSLSDFTENLQKITKVKFFVAPDLADRKVTVIFHDRPAIELMDAMRAALFVDWKDTGSGYRLIMPIEASHEETDMIDEERNALASGIRNGLEAYAKSADLTEEQRADEIKRLELEITDLATKATPDTNPEISADRLQLAILRNRSGAPIAKAFSNDLTTTVQALMAGQIAFASTRQGDNVPMLPQNSATFLRGIPPDAAGMVSMMRLDTKESNLTGRTATITGSPTRVNVGWMFHCPLESTRGLRSSKLLARLDKWSKERDPTVLGKKMAVDGPREIGPGYKNEAFTLAEHLEYIADRADVPVVSDAFRLSCSPGQYRSDSTVGEYLTGLQHSYLLKGTIGPTEFGYYRTFDGWLLARHNTYWRKIIHEIPESVILPLEFAAQSKSHLSTDDYTTFAASLGPENARFVARGDALMNWAVRFSSIPLHQSFYSLRLWSTLSDAQRKLAETDSGLDLSHLSATQSALMSEAWFEKMWRGKVPPIAWAAFFTATGLSSLSPVLHYTESDGKMFLGQDAVKLGPPQNPLPTGPAKLVGFHYFLKGNAAMGEDFSIESPG